MTEVSQYVYDVSHGMALMLSERLQGKKIEAVWHTCTYIYIILFIYVYTYIYILLSINTFTAIVVYGYEYFFDVSGIQYCQPMKSSAGIPLRIYKLGTTNKTIEEFNQYLQDISNNIFGPTTYSLLNHNCNNFSDTCCRYFFPGHGIPQFIIDLPKEALCSPMGSALLPAIESMQQKFSTSTVSVQNNTNETVSSEGGGYYLRLPKNPSNINIDIPSSVKLLEYVSQNKDKNSTTATATNASSTSSSTRSVTEKINDTVSSPSKESSEIRSFIIPIHTNDWDMLPFRNTFTKNPQILQGITQIPNTTINTLSPYIYTPISLMITRLQYNNSLYNLIDEKEDCKILSSILTKICLDTTVSTIHETDITLDTIKKILPIFHILLLKIKDPLDAFAVMGVYQGLLLNKNVIIYYDTITNDIYDDIHEIVNQVLLFTKNSGIPNEYIHIPIRLYAFLVLVHIFHSSKLSKYAINIPNIINTVSLVLGDQDPVLRTLAAICITNFSVRFSESQVDTEGIEIEKGMESIQEDVRTSQIEALLCTYKFLFFIQYFLNIVRHNCCMAHLLYGTFTDISEHVGKEKVAFTAYNYLLALLSLVRKDINRGTLALTLKLSLRDIYNSFATQKCDILDNLSTVVADLVLALSFYHHQLATN